MNVRHRLPSAAAAFGHAAVSDRCQRLRGRLADPAAESGDGRGVRCRVDWVRHDVDARGRLARRGRRELAERDGHQDRPRTAYKPDVQFAPLYLAKGTATSREGLDIDFQYGDESSFVQLVAAGRRSHHGQRRPGDPGSGQGSASALRNGVTSASRSPSSPTTRPWTIRPRSSVIASGCRRPLWRAIGVAGPRGQQARPGPDPQRGEGCNRSRRCCKEGWMPRSATPWTSGTPEGQGEAGGGHRSPTP